MLTHHREFGPTLPIVHDSGPMPWPRGPTDIERAELRRVLQVTAYRQCRGESCYQGRRPCAHPELCVSDDVLDAQAAGARMAMGDQAPSAPVPLGRTPQERYSRSADVFCIVVAAIGAVALAVHLWARA